MSETTRAPTIDAQPWNSSYRALSSTPQPRLPTQRVALLSEASPLASAFVFLVSVESSDSSAFLFLEGFSAAAGFSSADSVSSSEESESEPEALESSSSSD